MHVFPDKLTEAMVQASIIRSLQSKLSGVFVRGTLPPGGAVLAANHGSWWDGFLLGVLIHDVGRRATIMMSVEQLREFPFLSHVGAVPTTALNRMIDDARAGKPVVIFPEGALQPGRKLAPLHSGAARIAKRAAVPLIPIGVRVLMRGDERPEAFLDIKKPVEPDQLAQALETCLQELDALLDASDPERNVPGFTQLASLNHTSRLRKRASLALRALTSSTPKNKD